MGIGDQIGEALKVDHLTLGKMRGKYARVCVNIDLSKPWVKGIHLGVGNGKYWQPFRYEAVPIVCFCCGRIGHNEESCPERVSEKTNEESEGDASNVAATDPTFTRREGKAPVQGDIPAPSPEDEYGSWILAKRRRRKKSGNASNNQNQSQSNQKQKPDPRENRDRSGLGKNSGANQSGRRPENRNTGKGKANKHAIFCNGS